MLDYYQTKNGKSHMIPSVKRMNGPHMRLEDTIANKEIADSHQYIICTHSPCRVSSHQIHRWKQQK
jgi:hypothetical protein